MTILIDTNILTRLAQPEHPMHLAASGALEALKQQGKALCIVPQVLYEYWAVSTRPKAQNGLQMNVSEIASSVIELRKLFPLHRDDPTLIDQWLQLVTQYEVKGKNAHDARLVAAMNVHGVNQILTFNESDFSRYDGITVLTPAAVLS
jgi:predicted nucleic acid-binding protein